jgi:hypothetical protein
MAESRDGTRSTERRAWGYSQTLRYNGRDTLNLKGLSGCTTLNHTQGLVPLTFSRDILEVDSSRINNDYRRDLHA